MPSYATSSAPGFVFPTCNGPWRAENVTKLLDVAFQEPMDAVPHETIAGAFHVQRRDGTRVGTVFELPDPIPEAPEPVEEDKPLVEMKEPEEAEELPAEEENEHESKTRHRSRKKSH